MTLQRVRWEDATTSRSGWKIRHVSQGASLRSIQAPDIASISTCWLAVEERPEFERVDKFTDRIIGIYQKILQRGTAPPIHPASEHQLLEACNIKDVLLSAFEGDISPALEKPPAVPSSSIQIHSAAAVDMMELIQADGLTESVYERQFVIWLQDRAPEAARWLIPQASFDLLLESAGVDGPGCRRCDFLVAPPGGDHFVVEIDGMQHNDQALADAHRDRLLADIGIDTVRVPATELKDGVGPNLSKIENRITAWQSPASMEALVWGPQQLHRLAFAVCEAIRVGFISGEEWTIRVRDPTELAVPLFGPYLEMFSALLRLWGADTAIPNLVTFITDRDCIAYERESYNSYRHTDSTSTTPDVEIRLECSSGPAETLHKFGPEPSIVIRSTGLRVRVEDETADGSTRITINEGDHTSSCLLTLLRAIFAKSNFREGQCEAIVELLEGRDVTVLLPTGAGKSLIYQLAGMCLPGRTIIIDPVIALIEDQLRSLREYGIDRAIGLSSQSTKAGQTPRLLRQFALGDALFCFVAPERCQMQTFRDAVIELKNRTPVNLAVIDEAHYVSEWGHSFRTSYLMLGNTLRDIGETPEGSPPPLAAMTGTASHAVLKDTIYQLGLRDESENSIIRPTTFDRKELRFHIRKTHVDNDEATLAGTLRALPGEFQEDAVTFFSTGRGDKTNCGLVFIPTVNGYHGVRQTHPIVESVVGATGVYTGNAPKGWDKKSFPNRKRDSTASFHANELICLVATNAFGVGIDKPNIRWIVHYGLPGSMEAYYQEVGRAGRNGKEAAGFLILSEFDSDRNRELLAEDIDIEEIRARRDALRRGESDDVTNALYFHNQNFGGLAEEVAQLLKVASHLEPGPEARRTELLLASSDQERTSQERAVHRLATLGIVRDYLKDYSGQRFVINVAGVTVDKIVGEFLKFVRRTQPQRLEAVQRTVDRNFPSVTSALETCARELITIVYETIERSRRRSLREMWLAARESVDGEELRSRILDYLTEGDIGPLLERLIDEGIGLADWGKHWAALQTDADAREWRGAAGRLLVSYPDHAGLLLTRGLVEAFNAAGDLDELRLNVQGAVSGALENGASHDTLEGAVEQALRLLERSINPREAIAEMIIATQGAGFDSERLFTYVEEKCEEQPELAILYLERVLEHATRLTDTLN